MARAQRTCGSFSSVQNERRSDDSCVQLIAFRWLDPLSALRYHLQTHLTHLQATFECDGTCRRVIGVVDRHKRATDPFCCIHVDSLCLCVLFVAMRRRAGVLPTFVHALTWEADACIWKNLERSLACDTLTTLRYSSNRNQSRKRNLGQPNVLPQLAMLSPGLRDPVSSVRKRCWETLDLLRIAHNKTLHT